jgi:hypothetical protein
MPQGTPGAPRPGGAAPLTIPGGATPPVNVNPAVRNIEKIEK